jgi:hypothetical protein
MEKKDKKTGMGRSKLKELTMMGKEYTPKTKEDVRKHRKLHESKMKQHKVSVKHSHAELEKANEHMKKHMR